MLIECWTDDCPITFDGFVIEVFTSPTRRWHVTQVEEVRLEEGRNGARLLRITARGGGISGYSLPEQSLPALGQLVAAVNLARLERYRLGPVRV